MMIRRKKKRNRPIVEEPPVPPTQPPTPPTPPTPQTGSLTVNKRIFGCFVC